MTYYVNTKFISECMKKEHLFDLRTVWEDCFGSYSNYVHAMRGEVTVPYSVAEKLAFYANQNIKDGEKPLSPNQFIKSE